MILFSIVLHLYHMTEQTLSTSINLRVTQGQKDTFQRIGADALRAWLDSQCRDLPVHGVLEVVVTTPSGAVRCIPDGVGLVAQGANGGGGA